MHWFLNGTWYAFLANDFGVLAIYGFLKWARGKK